jgi:hypothetical protein
VGHIVVELDVDFAGKTFAEVEAGVLEEVRRKVGPALQAELSTLIAEVGRPPCPQAARRSRTCIIAALAA